MADDAPTTLPPSSPPQPHHPAAASISIRPPSHVRSSSISPSPSATNLYIPPTPWLAGTWHVTHSSLPMWRKAQNVSITYTVLSTDSQNRPTFDNLVEYETLEGKSKTVKGVERPRDDAEGAWRWRGKGWLMIASSDWEVLGYGRGVSGGGEVEDVGEGEGEMERREDDWVVTYFAATLFTPSGVDVYCRGRKGVSGEVLEGIKNKMMEEGGEEVKGLVEGLFEVRRTGV